MLSMLGCDAFDVLSERQVMSSVRGSLEISVELSSNQSPIVQIDSTHHTLPAIEDIPGSTYALSVSDWQVRLDDVQVAQDVDSVRYAVIINELPFAELIVATAEMDTTTYRMSDFLLYPELDHTLYRWYLSDLELYMQSTVSNLSTNSDVRLTATHFASLSLSSTSCEEVPIGSELPKCNQ